VDLIQAEFDRAVEGR